MNPAPTAILAVPPYDFVRPEAPATPRDWTGDFTHENGNYTNRCIFCELPFRGHKRRVACRSCALASDDRP